MQTKTHKNSRELSLLRLISVKEITFTVVYDLIGLNSLRTKDEMGRQNRGKMYQKSKRPPYPDDMKNLKGVGE